MAAGINSKNVTADNYPKGQSYRVNVCREIKMGICKYKESSLGTYYHIYNRGNQKMEIFRDTNDYQIYLRKLVKFINRYNFSLISYCLMPNHVHLILKQLAEFAPSKLISSLHTSYAMIFNKKYNSAGHIFQDRFKQKIIADDEYMICLICYIHLNPVKDKLCKTPDQYIWSSYREYAGLNKYPRCDHQLFNNYSLKGQQFENLIRSANKIDERDAFDTD